jgi:peptidoglycan/xylan/chitin deacetylase (PgdA/CDA1 family)
VKIQPRFRNDDVSYDTEMNYFTQFCDIFSKYGFIQTHAVSLRGLCNYSHLSDGKYHVYEGYGQMAEMDNATIRALSEPYRVENNAKLIGFLNNSDDEIALHGLYHTDYTQMSDEEQYGEMREGLAQLQAVFPQKKISWFVPPFNRRNHATYAAAKKLGLRVVGDEGVHLEESLPHLILEPGVWYRYHHHRFYPTSTFNTLPLSMEALDNALADAANGRTSGFMPVPSHDYPGDLSLLQQLVAEHQTQTWHFTTARDRLDRRELALGMGWIFNHIPHETSIFEVGCGGGNNLVWLARHGYAHLGGSDMDDNALAVARGMATSLDVSWRLEHADLLAPEHTPQGTGVLLAMNCTYLLDAFSLEDFLRRAFSRLAKDGYAVTDQIDVLFNRKPGNQYHSADLALPKEQRRGSEYRVRYSLAEVRDIAEKLALHIECAIPSFQSIPRVVYVFGRENAAPETRRPIALRRGDANQIQADIAGIFQSGLFDWDWYRERYVRGPEIMDPLEHYVRFGAAKGYWPNPAFNTNEYRNRRMDPHDATNPLAHSILANQP